MSRSSRRKRRELARMQSRASKTNANGYAGPEKAAVALASAMNHFMAPDAPPAPAPAPAKPRGFPSLIAGFLEKLRERCEQQSGRGDEWRSRGQSYKWKLIQDDTPKKAVCAVYRMTDEGDLIRSQSVYFDSRGFVVVGPRMFREVSEAIMREDSERRIPDPFREGYKAGDIIEAPDGQGAAMALSTRHLACITNSLCLMGNILSYFGIEDDSSRMDLIKECITICDSVLSLADKRQAERDGDG